MAALLPFSASSQGDQSSNPPDTNAAPAVASAGKTSLGDVAEIEIPARFRLIDKDRTAAFLKASNNQIPAGLLGILAHDSANWFAVIEFAEMGYLKDVSKNPLDSTALLEAMRAKVLRDNLNTVRQGGAPITALNWERKPVFDPILQTLTWAVRVETAVARTVNYSMLIFGRNGVLEITAVQPADARVEMVPMDALARKINFKDGHRYEDYQAGDKLAPMDLMQLIVNDQEPAPRRQSIAGSFFHSWIFYALAGCVALGGVVTCVVIGRKVVRQLKEESGYRAPVYASVAANGSGHNGANGHGKHNGHNGRSNGSGKGRRKVVFDYSKFYVDFVMSSSNATGAAVINEMSAVALGAESAPAPLPVPATESRPTPASPAEDLELVERLRTLIEEQKRLIHQQTRLIEEKNKFIEEQNEFLERQSALVKDQFTLKLE